MILLLHGDCLNRLQEQEPESITCVLCDPPYDLVTVSRKGSARKPGTGPFGRHTTSTKGFGAHDWDGTGIAFKPELWSHITRVMAPGASIGVFGGTRTFHKMAAAMERAGLQDIRLEAWCYASGFPKSHNIAVYMDRILTEGTARKVIRKGVGNLNGRFADALVGFVSQSKQHVLITEQGLKWDGWGTALKPAWEPIITGRKP